MADSSGNMNLFTQGHLSTTTRHVYWGENVNGDVKRTPIDDFTKIETLFNLTSIRGLGIDWRRKKLYTSDTSGDDIRRFDLDGSNNEIIVPKASGINNPTNLIYNKSDDKIYFVSVPTSIDRADFDGQNVETIYNGQNVDGIGIDLVDNHLYFSEDASGIIARSNFDGSDVTIILSGLVSPQDVKVDSEHRKLWWSDNGDQIIYISDLDGSNQSGIITGLIDPQGILPDPYGKRTYWGDVDGALNDRVEVSDYDGSNREVIYANTTSFDPRVVAVEPIDKFDLFIDGLPGARLDLFIEGASASGTQVSGILDLFIAGKPSGNIDLFEQGHNISSGNIDLFIAGILSGNIDLFEQGHNVASGNTDLFLHGHESTSSNKLYFTDSILSQILSVNLDGSNLEVINE